MMDDATIRAHADVMTFEQAADILTWTDEPDLLAQPGEPVPTFHAIDIAAARVYSARMMIRLGHERLATCT